MSKSFKHILLVDDDADTINFIKKVLSNLGASFHVASNIEEAIDSLQRIIPHLIITDIKLEEESGMELLYFLKNNSVFKGLPVLMMSGTTDKETIYSVINQGADDFISKPIVTKILLAKVKKHLREYELPSLKYNIEDAPRMNIRLPAYLFKINELSCLVKSSVKFPQAKEINIKSAFLEALGASQLKLRCLRDSKIVNPGMYITELGLIGMDEKTAQKIRAYKTAI